MQIDVSFTPAFLPPPERRVCIVIDALRATSTLTTMFARGLASALVVGSLAAARREAARHSGWLLCGEKRSLPPRGFDFGNSPVEFSRLQLTKRSAVLATTNGTRALLRASRCRHVLAGSLLNASAVAGAAKRLATESKRPLLIQCAGEFGGRGFALEDAFCAGAIVDQLLDGAREHDLNDEAVAALRLYQAYDGDAAIAFGDSRHGAGLASLGLPEDVSFCAQRDAYRNVPAARIVRNALLLRDLTKPRAGS